VQLDAALVTGTADAAQGWTLVGRHAFDFNRRLGSVLVSGPEGTLLIVKGAPEAMLALCTLRHDGTSSQAMGQGERAQAMEQVHALAEQGLRTVAVASKPWSSERHEIEAADETDLAFEGLCAFADPPKATAAGAITRLAAAGVRLKILSGDDPIVVKRLAGANFTTQKRDSVPGIRRACR
jgi:P-type Mg2+ transporter